LRQQWFDLIEQNWGGPVDLDDIAPSVADDPQFKKWWSAYLRQSASPAAALSLGKMNTQIDVRDILSSIQVPTLMLHRVGDNDVHIEEARYIASQIPGAKLVELPGVDHIPIVGDTRALLDEVEEFLTGTRPTYRGDRVLATILFTDIVSSTRHAAALGDEDWHSILEHHHDLVRTEISRFSGEEVETAGDSFLVTFDGPARAIRCACAIRDAVKRLGIDIRAGLHTGEIELLDEKARGIGVHIASRVLEKAGPGEVLVSRTVRDLISGSGIDLKDKGVHQLRGISEAWRLYAVES
jgi:class 3 adenylate cyclase